MGELDSVGEEHRFQLLVDAVTDYAIYLLDADGRIASWNPGAERIKGYRAREVLGRHYGRFFTEPDRKAGLPQRGLDIARETGRYEAEGWRVRKDGSLFWASVVLDAIRDKDGKHIGYAKITRDITERRKAQTELQAAQQQLAQAQKMEAVGQLTGGVAHDFNNLMMIVSGQAQALRHRIGEDPRALRALQAIDMAVNRGETLTRQLLTFSRRQHLNPRPIDLRGRIEAFRDMLSSSLRGDVEMAISIPDGIWPVSVDVGELQLALVNLAVNARDAMPNGGRFGIAACNATLAEGDAGLELEGDFVALALSDTGVGIPPDILPKVFEPFFTTKEAGKGTGLGLSQVYGLAHQSGGAVTIDSTLGEGSVITLYLPRTLSAPAAAAPEREPEPSSDGGGRILVVEDNPDVAAVSAALLEQLGYAPEVVANAEAALQALAGGKPFELVFSDIVMAGAMDGISLARQLRQIAPGLPVLLASGYSRAAESVQGEFAIMRKPYHVAELGRMVGRLIAAAHAGVGQDNVTRFPGGPARARR